MILLLPWLPLGASLLAEPPPAAQPAAPEPAAAAAPAGADTAPDRAPEAAVAATTLSFAEAVALALRQATEARGADEARRTAEARLRLERASSNPDLVASASAGLDTGLAAAGSSHASLRLSSSTALFEGGALVARRDEARARLSAAKAGVAETAQALTLLVAEGYLDLAAAEAQRDAAQARLGAEEALTGRVAALVAAGARTRADLYQQEATTAAARAELSAAVRDAALARLALMRLLQLDPGRSWRFGALPPAGTPSRADGGAARPELVALTAGVKAATAAEVAARAGGLPSVGLDLSTGVDLGDDPSGVGLAVGLGLSVPLSARGVVRHDLTVAGIELEAARRALEEGQRAVRLDVAEAEVELEAATAGVDAARVRERSAQAAAEVVQQRYEAGAALWTELTQVRADRADAERARIAAEVALERARWRLRWALGDCAPPTDLEAAPPR